MEHTNPRFGLSRVIRDDGIPLSLTPFRPPLPRKRARLLRGDAQLSLRLDIGPDARTYIRTHHRRARCRKHAIPERREAGGSEAADEGRELKRLFSTIYLYRCIRDMRKIFHQF